MTTEFTQLGLSELVKLQDELGRHIRARFERTLALVFSDVVDSTVYFERHGPVAGRALLQRHLDLLARTLATHGGRVVDTAGDGAFSVFSTAVDAANAMIELQRAIEQDNGQVAPEQRLSVRVGLHHGTVLSDGVIVTGDAVHEAARVAGSARGGEIRLSAETLGWLPPALRMRARSLGRIALKGLPEPIEVALLAWRDPSRFPTRVINETTGEVITLPDLESIRFGRLVEHEGAPANEIVLRHPDPVAERRVSRWQFRLLRRPEGYVLTRVSDAVTEVDGKLVPMGEFVPIHVGSRVEVSKVVTLRFAGDEGAGRDDHTIATT